MVAAADAASEREAALKSRVNSLEIQISEIRATTSTTKTITKGGTQIIKRKKVGGGADDSAAMDELAAQLAEADEEVESARERAAELETELEWARAELEAASSETSEREYMLQTRISMLENVVEQQKSAAAKAEKAARESAAAEAAETPPSFAETPVSDETTTDQTTTAAAAANVNNVGGGVGGNEMVSASEAKALAAEVDRLETLLAVKAASMAEVLDAMEAERAAGYKTAWSPVLGLVNKVFDAGREARKNPNVKEVAARLRRLLADIEGVDVNVNVVDTTASKKADADAIRAAETAAEEARGQLSAAQARVDELQSGASAQERELTDALALVKSLQDESAAAVSQATESARAQAAEKAAAAASEAAKVEAEAAAAATAAAAKSSVAEEVKAKLEEIRALEVKLADAESKAKNMERAFSVQEFEVREGIEQVNIMRGERETAEAEVERLTAQLAAGTHNHTTLKRSASPHDTFLFISRHQRLTVKSSSCRPQPQLKHLLFF